MTHAIFRDPSSGRSIHYFLWSQFLCGIRILYQSNIYFLVGLYKSNISIRFGIIRISLLEYYLFGRKKN